MATVATTTASTRRRWWRNVGDDPGEADELERLIAGRVEAALRTGELSPETIEQTLERHKAFLRYRFGGHLRNYRQWGGKYAFAFAALSVAIIISGLSSSGIAAGWSGAHWARWTILALGLVSGVAATVNQIWRPGEKAASRMRGANALCAEAWAFLERRGRYRRRDLIQPAPVEAPDLPERRRSRRSDPPGVGSGVLIHPVQSELDDERDAFGLFVDEVLRIIQQAAAVDEANTEPPNLPASGSKS